MRKQQKIEFYAVCFPIARCLAVVLFFDNYLFCLETDIPEYAHNLKSERFHHTFLPCVAHKYGAKFILFKHAITFLGDFAHFKQKFFHRQTRQIAVIQNSIKIPSIRLDCLQQTQFACISIRPALKQTRIFDICPELSLKPHQRFPPTRQMFVKPFLQSQ